MKKKISKKKSIKKNISKSSKKKKITKKRPSKKKISKKINHKKKSVQLTNQKSVVNFRFPLIDGIIKKNPLIIPSQSRVEGEIINHTVIVQGQFNGTIKSNEVFILDNSKITGEIITNVITIYGKCHANIHSKNLCIIKPTAVVKGDINYDGNLSIEVGGKVYGSLIPKKKPLALPNYATNHKNEPQLISEEINLNQDQYQPQFKNKKNSNNKSLDSLINKIFK